MPSARSDGVTSSPSRSGSITSRTIRSGGRSWPTPGGAPGVGHFDVQIPRSAATSRRRPVIMVHRRLPGFGACSDRSWSLPPPIGFHLALPRCLSARCEPAVNLDATNGARRSGPPGDLRLANLSAGRDPAALAVFGPCSKWLPPGSGLALVFLIRPSALESPADPMRGRCESTRQPGRRPQPVTSSATTRRAANCSDVVFSECGGRPATARPVAPIPRA